MSSIHFPPNGHRAEPPAHDEQYYQPGFDTGSSGFQLNPMSVRTPRSSTVGGNNSSVYGHSIYESKEDPAPEPTSDDEEQDSKVVAAERRIDPVLVWRDLFITSNGRDKAFKLMQYSIRLLLLLHSSLTQNRFTKASNSLPSRLTTSLIKRLDSTATGLSFSRKLLLLFNWLGPLTSIMAQQSVPFSAEESKEMKSRQVKPFLHTVLYAPPPTLLELASAVSDDIATFSRLGLLGVRTGDRAGRFSDWCWFLATIVGLVENGVERSMLGNLQRDAETRMYKESMSGATANSKSKSSKQDDKELSRLQKQDYWLQITRAKYLMDLIFVSYDICRIKRAANLVKTFAGLIAAILSASKLYERHKTLLVKTIR